MTMSWKQHQNACKALNFIWIFKIWVVFAQFDFQLVFFFLGFRFILYSFWRFMTNQNGFMSNVNQSYEMFTSFNRKIIAMRCYTIGQWEGKKKQIEGKLHWRRKMKPNKIPEEFCNAESALSRNVCAMHNKKKKYVRLCYFKKMPAFIKTIKPKCLWFRVILGVIALCHR